MKIILVLVLLSALAFPVSVFCGETCTTNVGLMDETDKRNLHTLQITFILSRHLNNKFFYMASLAMGLRGEKFMYNDWEDLKSIDQELDICGKLIFQIEKNFSGEKMDLVSDTLHRIYLRHRNILKKLKSLPKQAPT